MMPFLAPMLAVSGEPFDSDEHLFEVKWDGIRALALVEGGQGRVWGREGADYTARYPELEFLGRWPAGRTRTKRRFPDIVTPPTPQRPRCCIASTSIR